MASARKPICAVRLNATDALLLGNRPQYVFSNQWLTGVIEAEVVNNNYYSADTFRIVVALTQAPKWFTTDYISGQLAIPVEIMMGPTDDDAPCLIEGLVDDFDFNPTDNTVELRGRDYTRFFIDSKATQSWVNQTIASVVSALAEKYGLAVETGGQGLPTAPVGFYLGQYQVKMGDGRTEWDLLTWLAGQFVDLAGNSYVTYVRRKVLYFGPRPYDVSYYLNCQRDPVTQRFSVLPATDPGAGPAWGVTSLKFSRNLSVLRDPVVVACSPQQGAATQLVAYPRSYQGIDPNAPTLQPLYLINVGNNVPPDALARMAQARQQDISRHEVRMSAVLPGDSVLTQLSLLQVSGVGDAFDQTYFIRSVTRRFTLSGGYVMECDGQNQAPNDVEDDA